MQQEIQIKNFDHLGLIAGMIDELGIVECIDKKIPKKSDDKLLSYGELVKAMILNGLGYVNKQLYLVPKFFSDKPLNILFKRDVKAEWFNDDSLGRTLDALYQYGVSKLYQIIALKAMNVLGLIPKTFHLDSTSFHVDGEYKNTHNNSDENRACIKITKGYSRDHHPELNQVVLNLIVEHQGGIPVWMKPGNGNQSDTKEFAKILKEHIKSLKKTNDINAKIIADAALFTSNGIKEIKDNNMLFISRVPATLKQVKEILQNHNPQEFIKLDENYQAITYSVEYEGMKQKWVLYKSSYAKSRKDKTIQKEYQKKQKQESRLLAKLQKTVYFCESDAKEAFKEKTSKLESLTIKKKELIVKPKYKTKGRPKANAVPSHYEYYWKIETIPNEEYLKQKQNQKSGLFILATNDITMSAKELLDEYKSQQRVERGFRFLKSPEFLVDSLYLKNPKRIESLLMIMTLSLMVYSALEYRIRKELTINNETFPNQLGKPVQNPTARWVFANFFAIHLLIMNNTTQIIGLNSLHRQILRLLGRPYQSLYDISSDKVNI